MNIYTNHSLYARYSSLLNMGPGCYSLTLLLMKPIVPHLRLSTTYTLVRQICDRIPRLLIPSGLVWILSPNPTWTTLINGDMFWR
jgi:hypothetical protein